MSDRVPLNMTGILFKNNSENPKAPTYTGKATLFTDTYRIAAWVKTDKNGQKYLSLNGDIDREYDWSACLFKAKKEVDSDPDYRGNLRGDAGEKDIVVTMTNGKTQAGDYKGTLTFVGNKPLGFGPTLESVSVAEEEAIDDDDVPF